MGLERRSLAVNQANWDERAPAHAASPDYAVDRFRTDPSFLSQVLRFDLPRLGDVSGLRGIHLQCHIGTDTISLARLGARMTGLDFSPASIFEARRLASATSSDVDFVESDIYTALDVLPAGRFDLVFTGVGALCWLPDISGWARIVADLLRPGGRLFLREGHPMMWAMDDRIADRIEVAFPYFEVPSPLIWEDTSTYVDIDVPLRHSVTHSWNHGIGEIITALLNEGMTLTQFVEHDSVPWEALPGQMHQGQLGEWRLVDRPERLALSYTLQAVKPA
ncbi:MAG TPA: class I SAM-dependent methyltransferase [Pseudonocardia sp.]|jgi:SAM-dependent methyltransferase|nr:class I SAM-dependent methyltransferase [Pseudonocardia sp.]